MASSTKPKLCRDCVAQGIKTRRRIKRAGRCATHDREFYAARRKRGRDKRTEELYGLTPEQYDAIYEAQGRQCYICQRAKGTGRRRLAVDHDHALAKLHDHPEERGCPLCVRGLLCSVCNTRVLGHLRDEIAALQRAINYLRNPPARKVLG